MSDRKKAAEYLETCMRNRVISESFSEVIISLTKAEEIFAMLKEQEAELSFREAKAITHTATKLDDATCPSCGNVIRVRYDYCHYCGQKLDWESR